MTRGAITVFALLVLSALVSDAQVLELHSYTNLNRLIPDGNGSGLSETRVVVSGISNLTSVRVHLRITGEYNGDLYAYLRHIDGGTTNLCVLLNRPGRAADNQWGYADSGLDIVFDDSSATDVHAYRGVTTPEAGLPLTGSWQPDGRKVFPSTVLDTSPRTTALSVFNGGTGSGEWTLYLVDYSGGGTNMLTSWALELVPPAQVSIAGNVAYYQSGLPVAGVTLSVNDAPDFTTLSLNDGSYVVPNLPTGGTYCVAPRKASDSVLLAGVSSLDLVILQRHIVRRTLLNSPFKLLAADGDGSSTINSVDLVTVQRLIVRRTNQVPAGVWRFVRSDYSFPDPQNPWGAPAECWHTNLLADGSAGFTAIKYGDVDGSWSPPIVNSLAMVQKKREDPAVSFFATGIFTDLGKRVLLKVTAAGFRKVTSAQFTLSWDPKVLRYMGFTHAGLDGVSAESFGDTLSTEGMLPFAWYDPAADGLTLPDGTVLFSLEFEVLAPGNAVISFDDSATPREVSSEFVVVPFHSEAGLSYPDLRVTDVTHRDGIFTLSIPTQRGFSYSLEYSDSLERPRWNSCPESFGTGEALVLQDSGATNQQRFYRIKVR